MFIVGANPATTVPFWPYWDATIGFDKGRWTADYEASRVASGKRPRSNTRERIERVVAALAPFRVLETNAFVSPSASIAELERSRRSVEILRFLIASIQPDVVLAHGNDAHRAIAQVRTSGATFHVIESRHLRLVTYARASELGHEIREVVASLG